jgi:Spy/CpxP family protein refolding chaperone
VKLTRTRKLIGGLALAGVVALTGVVSSAQQATPQGQPGQTRAEGRRERDSDDRGMHGMKGGFAGRFAESLNLTAAQKEQIEQIAARYRESAKAQHTERGMKHGEGDDFDAFSGGTFDEAAVRAAAQARANARVEAEVAHARMLYEMYNVLTPEQKAQLAAQRQQWEQKRQQWRAGHKATPDQHQ